MRQYQIIKLSNASDTKKGGKINVNNIEERTFYLRLVIYYLVSQSEDDQRGQWISKKRSYIFQVKRR